MTSIATRGHVSADEWVDAYFVSYGRDDILWTYVYDDVGLAYEFTGNRDRDSVVQHSLTPPFTARYVRLHVLTYHAGPSLRWDVTGCDYGGFNGISHITVT